MNSKASSLTRAAKMSTTFAFLILSGTQYVFAQSISNGNTNEDTQRVSVNSPLNAQRKLSSLNVVSVGGSDRWSQRVKNEITPKTHAALVSLNNLAMEEYGVDLSAQMSFVLRATRKANIPSGFKDENIIGIEAGLGEAELRNRSLVFPIQHSTKLLVEQLTQGKSKGIPVWLTWGLAERLAQQTIEGLNLTPLPSYAQEPPLSRPNISDEKKADRLLQEQKRARLAEKVRILAITILQEKLGARFHQNMRNFLHASTQANFNVDNAFSEHLGFSQAQLLKQIEQRIAQPEAVNVVNSVVSPSTNQVVDTAAITALNNGIKTFYDAKLPRALVASSEGVWSVVEKNPRAIDLAQKECKDKGGKKCRIYAVDDYFVPDPNKAFVSVQMGGFTNDSLAERVQRKWLPLVRQAALQFDSLVNDVLKVQLVRDARMYVAAGDHDYEQIMIQDMKINPANADKFSEVSGGLSAGNGQIALRFKLNMDRLRNYDVAVNISLHELTHELQKQTSNNYPGFLPPPWFIEGNADLIADLLAPQVRINDAESEPLHNWRLSNLIWWLQKNETELQPEEMQNIKYSTWLDMSKNNRGNYQMAGLMCMYLQAITGDHYLERWVKYHRLAAVKGNKHDESFKLTFDMSEADFIADFKLWLKQQ
jgi:hypothetical protein